MANKIIYRVVIGVIILVILSIIYWVLAPLFNGVSMEFYIRLALLFLAGIMFGVLRIYNAIVGNTRFLIKMKQVIAPLNTDIVTLRTNIGRLGNRITKNTESLRSLGDTISNSTEAFNKLKNTIDSERKSRK